MKKGNEIKIAIPALRFPEFQDTEGWKEYILGDCLLEQPRYGINAPAVPFQKELPTYIRITDISENGCFLPNPKVSVNHGAINDFYLNIGDLVFARTGASVGKCYKYKEKDGKLVFAGFLIKVSPDQTRLSPDFLFQFTFTQQYWKWIDLTSTRSGQPGINSKELATMELYLPVKDEQQKIADCLSSLDDLIEATAQKVDALKEHKKGLMQRLFPAEGKNVPDLRFPRFQASEKWKECILGNCLLEQPRYGINAPAVPFQKELPTYIRITDISEDGYFLPNPKVSVNHDAVDNFYLEIGDLVFARTGASVGKCYKYRKEDGKLVFAGFLIKVSPDQTRLSPDFLFQFTFSQLYWKWVDLTSTRSGQPGINSKEFASMMLYLPTKDEQQKIADCLSSLDELIEATSRKVEILKEHKKGLIQQLFPKI